MKPTLSKEEKEAQKAADKAAKEFEKQVKQGEKFLQHREATLKREPQGKNAEQAVDDDLLKQEMFDDADSSKRAATVDIGPSSKQARTVPEPGLPRANPVPPLPKKPNLHDPIEIWDAYYADITAWVPSYLPGALKDLVGMDLQGIPLHHIAPARIEDNLLPTVGGVPVMTCREAWDPVRAVMAMNTTGKYEGAGNIFWFAFPKGQMVYFLQESLFRTDNKQAAIEAARSHWTIEAYNATGETINMRHLLFPEIFPTACAGIQDAEHTIESPKNEKGMTRRIPTFQGLPLLAGWPVVLAWMEAIFEAIQAGNKPALRNLFEADICKLVLWEKSNCPFGGRLIHHREE